MPSFFYDRRPFTWNMRLFPDDPVNCCVFPGLSGCGLAPHLYDKPIRPWHEAARGGINEPPQSVRAQIHEKTKGRNKTVWSSAPLKMHPAPFPSFLQLLSLSCTLLPPPPSTPVSHPHCFFFFKSPWPESWGPGGFGAPSRMRSKSAGGERAWDERGNEKEERLSSQNRRKGKQRRGMRAEETVK